MSYGDALYNDAHRAFLQAFMARSILTFEDAKPILAAILTAQDRNERETLPGDITQDIFEGFVESLNNKLSPLDLEIRSTRSQFDRAIIYALVNTTSDALTQVATSHTPDEIAFVKRLLDAMFDTNNNRNAEIMAVTTTQGTQLAKPPRQSMGGDEQTQGNTAQGLSLSQAEKVMASMVAEGWFEKSAKNWLSLSPRALVELREWLVVTYNLVGPEEDGSEIVEEKIKYCEACRDIVTVGQRCSNYDCNCRLHNICTQQFFRESTNRKCPKCKSNWTGDDHVGEKAARSTARPSNGARRNGAASPSRRRTRDEVEEDDDEEE